MRSQALQFYLISFFFVNIQMNYADYTFVASVTSKRIKSVTIKRIETLHKNEAN